MEHAAHLVDILDETGHIIGQKQRKEIDKTKDIYNSIFVLLITPDGQVVLSKIPKRDDLPNLYPDRLGISVVTIRRNNEAARDAATRVVARELFIDNAQLQLVGEDLFSIDNKYTAATLFYLIGNPPRTFSHTDVSGFEIMQPSELAHQIQFSPEKFAPTLTVLWQEYYSMLPL